MCKPKTINFDNSKVENLIANVKFNSRVLISEYKLNFGWVDPRSLASALQGMYDRPYNVMYVSIYSRHVRIANKSLDRIIVSGVIATCSFSTIIQPLFSN